MTHHNAHTPGLQLPWHNIGMVLHVRDNHFVASLHLRTTERRGHEVDGLGGAPGENNLLGLAGIDELPDPLTCRLMQVGGLLAEIVNATVNVGIHVEILVAHGIEHAQWFLCGCCIVKIDQGPAIHLTAENGEVVAYLSNIVHNIMNYLRIDDSTGLRAKRRDASFIQLFSFSLSLHSLQPAHLLSSPRKRFSTR